MQTQIEGSPAFAYIHVDLSPGESIVAEADAMASMAADLDMKAEFNGGFIPAILKKSFGGESLFVNRFTNNTRAVRRVTLVQSTPGDIRELDLNGDTFCLQPSAYIASTPGVSLSVQWAGFRSAIAREGLFRLRVCGQGKVFYGAYGGLMERQIQGEFIVDSSHLVGYEPQMKLKIQLAGGLFASFFGGEGLVTRVEGTGKIILQSRSLSGLVGWLNPKLR